MLNRVDLLISILFDDNAREDERHDAAMDIGNFNDARALNALLKIATNPNENQFVLDACGESIAQIWVKRNHFDVEAYKKLQPEAQYEAKMYIQANKPEWSSYL